MPAPVTEKQTSFEHQEQEIRGEEVLRWLTYVGNDERKLAIILALDQADEPLGQSGIYRYISELAGEDGIPGGLYAPFQFCEDSLLQVNAVEATTAEVMRFGKTPEVAPAFEIAHSPDDREFAVAFAGALLDWSGRHPELPLNILGQTGGRAYVRAPLVRFWALYDVTTTPDSPKSPSISNIAAHLTLSRNTRSDTAIGFGN